MPIMMNLNYAWLLLNHIQLVCFINEWEDEFFFRWEAQKQKQERERERRSLEHVMLQLSYESMWCSSFSIYNEETTTLIKQNKTKKSEKQSKLIATVSNMFIWFFFLFFLICIIRLVLFLIFVTTIHSPTFCCWRSCRKNQLVQFMFYGTKCIPVLTSHHILKRIKHIYTFKYKSIRCHHLTRFVFRLFSQTIMLFLDCVFHLTFAKKIWKKQRMRKKKIEERNEWKY